MFLWFTGTQTARPKAIRFVGPREKNGWCARHPHPSSSLRFAPTRSWERGCSHLDSPVFLLNQYDRIFVLLSLTSHTSFPALDLRACSRSLRCSSSPLSAPALPCPSRAGVSLGNTSAHSPFCAPLSRPSRYAELKVPHPTAISSLLAPLPPVSCLKREMTPDK